MITLTPAYGRDYRSKKDVLKDFNDNKDFIINDLFGPLKQWDSKPVNKPQLMKHGIRQVNIRYKKLTCILPINVN